MSGFAIGGKDQKKKTNLRVKVKCQKEPAFATRRVERPALRFDVSYRGGGSNVLLFPCDFDGKHALRIEKLLQRATEATLKSRRKKSGSYTYDGIRIKDGILYSREETVRYVLIDAKTAAFAGLPKSAIGCYALRFETVITEFGEEDDLVVEKRVFPVTFEGLIDRADLSRLLVEVRRVRRTCCAKTKKVKPKKG